jgi:hypothetical protein
MAELSGEVIAFLSEGTRTGMLGFLASDGRPLVVRVQPTKVNATCRVSG